MKIFGYEIKRINTKVHQLHRDYKTVIEFAFEIDGVKYYEFKNILDMPSIRYKKCMEFIREAEMSITSSDLVELIKMSMDYINKGNLARSIIIQNGITNLASQYMETDTFYRLFSCCFFDLEEDLTDYDYDYNELKIKSFKTETIPDFFLKEPIKRYIPQPNILPKDLLVFSKITKTNKEHLQKIKSEYIKGL